MARTCPSRPAAERALGGARLRAKAPLISTRVCVPSLLYPLLQFLVQLLFDLGVLLLLFRSQKRVDLFVTLGHDFPQLALAFQGPRAAA
jgi:hypothetical protein